MNQKTTHFLRIVLGAYLTYIGGSLLKDVIMNKPDDLLFKGAMGILFLVIGAGYTIWMIRRTIALYKEDTEQDREDGRKMIGKDDKGQEQDTEQDKKED